MENHIVLIVFVCFVCLVGESETSSWRSKNKKRKHEIYALQNGPEIDWMNLGEPCKDDLKKCKGLKSMCTLNIIKEKCKETCGRCHRLQSPPDCSVSEFGCCWDNRTIAKGKNQESCPACKDQYEECKELVSKCHRHDIKTMCPKSCGVQCKTCEDSRYQKTVCPLYRRLGFCRVSPGLMKKHCKRTCGFC